MVESDSPERIRQRIKGSVEAGQWLALVEEESPDYALGFWRKIAEARPKEFQPAPQTTLRPMNDQESRAFGNRLCPYRQYAGIRYDDVPRDYLDFLAESAKELSRYLGSRHREVVDRAEGE